MNYKAFISYKHSIHGSSHAIALEKALKTYAKPLLSPPMRIFRDEKHAVPDLDLPRLIEKGLTDSEFLIFLADKDAADSTWCQNELRYWCDVLKRRDRLIIVHIGHEIKLSADARKIDWEYTDALPKLLKEHIESVPFYIDLKWANKETERDLQHPDYNSLVNTLAAKIRGVTPESLNDEAIKIFRRNVRLRNTAILSLSIMLLISVAASFIAFKQTKEAETQRTNAINRAKEAVEQRKEAQKQKETAEKNAEEAVKQRKEAEKQKETAYRHAYSLSLKAFGAAIANKALQMQDENPTLALRMLEKSYKIAKDKSVLQSMNNLYSKGAFYSKSLKLPKQIGDIKAVHGNGDLLIAQGTEILLMDKNGKLLQTYSGHHKRINALAVSPDGSFFVSTGEDSLLIKWRHSQQEPIFKKVLSERKINAVAVSRNSLIAVSGSSRKVSIFSPQGVLVKSLPSGQWNIPSIAFSPDGLRVVTASATGFQGKRRDIFAKVWDISGNETEGKELMRLPHGDMVLAVNYDPIGQLIITGGGDGRLKLWNAENGKLLKELLAFRNSSKGSAETYVFEAEFSPDGQSIVSSSRDNAVMLWSRDGALLKSCIVHKGMDNRIHLAYDTNSNQFVSGGQMDKQLVFWDLFDAPIASYSQSVVDHPVLSQTGKYALTPGMGVKTVLFSIEDRRIIHYYQYSNIVDAGFLGDKAFYIQSADKVYLHLPSEKLPIRVLDGCQLIKTIPGSSKAFVLFKNGSSALVEPGQEKTLKLFTFADPEGIKSLAFNHLHKKIIIGRSNGALEWYNTNGKLVRQHLRAHSKPVVNVSLSPKDGKFISSSFDGIIKCWSPSGDLLGAIANPNLLNAKISPNSDLIIANSSSDIWYYNFDGTPLFTEKGNLGGGFSFNFSGNGKFMITGRNSGNPENKVLIRKNFIGLQNFLASKSLARFSDDELEINQLKRSLPPSPGFSVANN